jgi:ABC-type enterochelin transport system ATPase subunit
LFLEKDLPGAESRLSVRLFVSFNRFSFVKTAPNQKEDEKVRLKEELAKRVARASCP